MARRFKNNRRMHSKVLDFFENQKKFICDFEEAYNASCSMDVFKLCNAYAEKARKLDEKLIDTTHSILGL